MEGFSVDFLGPQLRAALPTDETVMPLDDLRLVNVLHLGFDQNVHKGQLIVHQSVADEVLEIFIGLLEMGFPIEKIKLVGEYGYSDDFSMADNNSSGFNFRTVEGSSELSWHAYGLAIDINPRINPYILANGAVLPANGQENVERSPKRQGLLWEDSPVVRLFEEYGWFWGGNWDVVKDYHHFEKPLET